MANELYRRVQGQRVDKDRACHDACANEQRNQDCDSMNLRHPSTTTGAAWCNLRTAYEETGYRTCKITLPGALCVREASNALRASIKGYVKEPIGLTAPVAINDCAGGDPRAVAPVFLRTRTAESVGARRH